MLHQVLVGLDGLHLLGYHLHLLELRDIINFVDVRMASRSRELGVPVELVQLWGVQVGLGLVQGLFHLGIDSFLLLLLGQLASCISHETCGVVQLNTRL